MKENEDKMAPGDALDEIRELMNRSTRSYLCGWSPLLCGLVALTGGLLVNWDNWFVVSCVTLVLGVLIPFVFSLVRAGKDGVQISFNSKNRRLTQTLFLPVFIGGVICIAMLAAGSYEWLAAVMLCFYGLAVFNLSGISEKSLALPGILLVAIGLAACFLRQYALTLWIVGFGGLHIIYGIYLIFKNRG